MNQIALEKKAARVMESCKTMHQIDAAQKYAMLYFRKTSDLTYFRCLIDKLNERIDSLDK